MSDQAWARFKMLALNAVKPGLAAWTVFVIECAAVGVRLSKTDDFTSLPFPRFLCRAFFTVAPEQSAVVGLTLIVLQSVTGFTQRPPMVHLGITLRLILYRPDILDRPLLSCLSTRERGG